MSTHNIDWLNLSLAEHDRYHAWTLRGQLLSLHRRKALTESQASYLAFKFMIRARLRVLVALKRAGAPYTNLIQLSEGLVLTPNDIQMAWIGFLSPRTNLDWRLTPNQIKEISFTELALLDKREILVQRKKTKTEKNLKSFTQRDWVSAPSPFQQPYIHNWTQTDWLWNPYYRDKFAQGPSLSLEDSQVREACFMRKPSVLWEAEKLLMTTWNPKTAQIARIHGSGHMADVIGKLAEEFPLMPEQIKKWFLGKSPRKLAWVILAFEWVQRKKSQNLGNFWLPTQLQIQGKDFFAEVLKTPEELKVEGSRMNHCVGNFGAYKIGASQGQCSLWQAIYNLNGETHRTTIEITHHLEKATLRQNMAWGNQSRTIHPELAEKLLALRLVRPAQEAPMEKEELWEATLSPTIAASISQILANRAELRAETHNWKRKSKEKTADSKINYTDTKPFPEVIDEYGIVQILLNVASLRTPIKELSFLLEVPLDSSLTKSKEKERQVFLDEILDDEIPF